MTEHEPHDVDNALDVIVQATKPIDDVYPWWKRLWVPLTIFGIAFLVGSLAGLFLAVSNYHSVREDERQDAIVVEKQERDECYSRYTERISDAVSLTRRTSARVDNLFGAALIRIAFGESDALTEGNREQLERAIVANDAALVTDREANEAREMWVAAGQPLPCPIDVPTDN